MPNRHAPHSHVSYPPKTHKPCFYCRQPMRIQHVRPEHKCTEHCHPHGAEHDYRMEQMPPIVRFFTQDGEEFCKECFDKPAHKRLRHRPGGQ